MTFFGIILLALIAIIAYAHYLQGFFSATISAIITVFAAVLAVSLHETVVYMWKPGRFPDVASGIILCALFALIYLAARLVFDKAIPGNTRLPFLADKFGAAAMGLVAGMFATGVIAIAAQTFPVGPSILGYAYYPVVDKSPLVILPGTPNEIERYLFDELKVDSELSPGTFPLHNASPLIGADAVVVNTVMCLSNGGSLAGDTPMASVHPNYLQELFGQRLGIEPGAKHTALDYGDSSQVQVTNMYRLKSLPQKDADISQVRGQSCYKPELPATLAPDASKKSLIVLRVQVTQAAADADNLFRFSPASIRLCAKNVDDPNRVTWRNYYPVGTVAAGKTLLVNHLDDPLFIKLEAVDKSSVDLAFVVDDVSDIITQEEGAADKPAQGAFLEVKRLARIELSALNLPVESFLKADPKSTLMRKPALTPVEKTGK